VFSTHIRRNSVHKQTYLKVPFVWEEPQPLIEVPPRLKAEFMRQAIQEALDKLEKQ
jgi:hypothetical protein